MIPLPGFSTSVTLGAFSTFFWRTLILLYYTQPLRFILRSRMWSCTRWTFLGFDVDMHFNSVQTQCRHLGDRCIQLRSTLQESTRNLEGTFITEIADELDRYAFFTLPYYIYHIMCCSLLGRINRQMMEWATWNRLRSFLQQGDIKDGVDRLSRELDYCMMRFNVC